MKKTNKTPCPYCNQEMNKKNIKRHIERYHSLENLIIINCKICDKSISFLNSFGDCCSRSCSSKKLKGSTQSSSDKDRISFFLNVLC